MAEEPDVVDADGDGVTTSTRARWTHLGSVLALLCVSYPILASLASYAVLGRPPDMGTAALAGFEAVAFTVWVVGQGVASRAADIAAGLGSSGGT